MLLHGSVPGVCGVRGGLPVLKSGQNSWQNVARGFNLLGVSGGSGIPGPQVLPLSHLVEYCFNVASLGVPRHMAVWSPNFVCRFFFRC